VNKKRALAVLALTSAVGLAVTACAGAAPTSETAAGSTDTINTELWYAPSVFDPAIISSDSDGDAARLGFDTLIRPGETEGFIGGLATEWEAASATDYVFTIRDDATCADGTVITPTIVADSLDYFATVDNAAAQAARSSVFGPETPTITADDAAGTVTVALAAPYADVLQGLSQSNTGIICPAGLADLEGLAAGTVDGAWSGPYTLESSTAGVGATYTLRDDYDAWPDWSVEGTPAKTINITVSSDSNTSANLLADGGIDITRFYDANVERFVDDDAFSYVTMPSSANTLIFNQTPGAGSVFLDNIELRTAVAQAIDPEGFSAAALGGLATPQTSIDASTVDCVIDGTDLLPGLDPAAAAKVLAGTTIRLLTVSNWDPAADFLAESLRAGGATVEVSALDPADWQSQMRGEPEKWDLAVNATSVANPLSQAIATYVGPTAANGGRNIAGVDNAEGYAFLQEGLAAADPEAQCEAFGNAQRTILEHVDVVPLVTDTHYVIAREGYASTVFSNNWDISSMRIIG